MITAFLSRSLNSKADAFCDLVMSELKQLGVGQFRTIGITDSSPKNLLEQVKSLIQECDICVCCMTRVYTTSNGQHLPTPSNSIETTIATDYEIPTMIFVEKGVTVPTLFVTNYTYIELDGTIENLEHQRENIKSQYNHLIMECGKNKVKKLPNKDININVQLNCVQNNTIIRQDNKMILYCVVGTIVIACLIYVLKDK